MVSYMHAVRAKRHKNFLIMNIKFAYIWVGVSRQHELNAIHGISQAKVYVNYNGHEFGTGCRGVGRGARGMRLRRSSLYGKKNECMIYYPQRPNLPSLR
jgi:hypothetical protein